MKSALFVAFAALAVSLVALGTSLVNRADHESGPPPVGDIAIDPHADVASRIDALVEDNAELRSRLAMLEAASPLTQRAPAVDVATRSDLEVLREELLAVLTGGLAAATTAEDPVFKEQVAATLDEIRETEQVAKREATLRRRVDRLDELLPKLETQLGLTGPQSDGLRTALTEHYERGAELERRWQAGESSEVLGSVKAEDYRVFQAALSEILNPQQLEGFDAAMGGSSGK